VAIDKLDSLLLEAEEMVGVKLAADQKAAELQALTGHFERWRGAWEKLQPQLHELRKVPQANALAEFFDWHREHLRTLESSVFALCRTAENDRLTLSKHVDDLLAGSRRLLMMPVASLHAPLPKMVRDLAHDQGKQVDLTIRGEDVEVDKRLLDEMKDPLIHLLRNCIDHGVESPEVRAQLGKPPRATITIEVAVFDSNQVEMLVSDDGSGIDVESVKVSAMERGMLSAESAPELSDREALALIFEPEVSTSKAITHLSGRGLGLAIVRERVESLGGRITVESRPQAGTTFRITLPMTLATFRGVLVSVGERVFVLPTADVERVLRFRAEEVRTVSMRPTLALRGRPIALVQLADLLQVPRVEHTEAPTVTPAVVLGSGNQRMAFVVDAVLGEQEIVVKRFKKPLVRVRYVAGVTVLGSGQVVPILRTADLLRFGKQIEAGHAAAPRPRPAAPAAKKTVLVAEDSITSRLLLKGVLESSGYRVKTAADGMEALTLLRSEAFDLLVSDVEMPRLNGFDLVARLRADRKLAELPVILVTALASREDRERGVEVGADAYLVKSSFDQGNLLATVRRLI
jgi:two-component system chemotaxis sensor kinase CheA